MEGGCLEGCAKGFFEMIRFEQHHGESMPGVKVIGIKFNAFAIEGGGLFEFAKGKVAAGIVKHGLDGFAQNFRVRITTRKDELAACRSDLSAVESLDVGGLGFLLEPRHKCA